MISQIYGRQDQNHTCVAGIDVEIRKMLQKEVLGKKCSITKTNRLVIIGISLLFDKQWDMVTIDLYCLHCYRAQQ